MAGIIRTTIMASFLFIGRGITDIIIHTINTIGAVVIMEVDTMVVGITAVDITAELG